MNLFLVPFIMDGRLRAVQPSAYGRSTAATYAQAEFELCDVIGSLVTSRFRFRVKIKALKLGGCYV